MSLYLKDNNDELQNREKGPKNVERRKWKEAPGYTSRILSALGVLCVLAVIVGIAAYMPILSKAETGTNLPPLPTKWGETSLPLYQFNQFSETVKLEDLTFLNATYDEGNNLVVEAAITTEEQLKAVLSGLKTSGTEIGRAHV